MRKSLQKLIIKFIVVIIDFMVVIIDLAFVTFKLIFSEGITIKNPTSITINQAFIKIQIVVIGNNLINLLSEQFEIN